MYMYLDYSWWIQHSTWQFWFVTDYHIVLFLSICNRHVTCTNLIGPNKEFSIEFLWKMFFLHVWDTYLISFNNIFFYYLLIFNVKFSYSFVLLLLELWVIFFTRNFREKDRFFNSIATIICNIKPRLVLILIRIFVCLCVHLLLRVI